MELKDVLDYLGLDAKDLEGFKGAFTGKYLTKADALDDDSIRGKITGKIAGAMATIAKRSWGFTAEEIKDKPWEEIIKMGIEKDAGKIKELEEAQGKGGDEAVKALQEKLDKATKTINEYKDSITLVGAEKEQAVKEWSEKHKSLRIETALTKAKEKVAKDSLIELSEEQQYFLDKKIEEKYKIDFDEKDEATVFDKEGKRIPNPNKAGAFLGIEDAIFTVAKEKGYDKKNPGGKVNAASVKTEVKTQDPDTTNTRKINPLAVAHVEALKEAVAKP